MQLRLENTLDSSTFDRGSIVYYRRNLTDIADVGLVTNFAGSVDNRILKHDACLYFVVVIIAS